LTFQTRQIETYTAKAIEALTAGTVIYLALCLSLSALMGWVERRTAIPGLVAGGRRRRAWASISASSGGTSTSCSSRGFWGVGALGGAAWRVALPSIVRCFILGVCGGRPRLSPRAWIRIPATIYV